MSSCNRKRILESKQQAPLLLAIFLVPKFSFANPWSQCPRLNLWSRRLSAAFLRIIFFFDLIFHFYIFKSQLVLL